MQRVVPYLWVVAVSVLTGCSGVRPTEEMQEVSGRVTVNGQPPEKLILNLTPITPGEGREDVCLVEKGEYRVKLIAGKYKVSFTTCPGAPKIPRQYLSAGTSALELDGTRLNVKDFDLK